MDAAGILELLGLEEHQINNAYEMCYEALETIQLHKHLDDAIAEYVEDHVHEMVWEDATQCFIEFIFEATSQIVKDHKPEYDVTMQLSRNDNYIIIH